MTYLERLRYRLESEANHDIYDALIKLVKEAEENILLLRMKTPITAGGIDKALLTLRKVVEKEPG